MITRTATHSSANFNTLQHTLQHGHAGSIYGRKWPVCRCGIWLRSRLCVGCVNTWMSYDIWMRMAHRWLSHGTHMNEAWRTYEWVMAHIRMSRGTHMSESLHTYEWVMAHKWMSHGTHTNESRYTYINESWHTYINESWHIDRVTERLLYLLVYVCVCIFVCVCVCVCVCVYVCVSVWVWV